MEVEARVLRAATGGDAAALRELVEALHRPIYALSLRTLGQREDAEEATQEALLRVVTHLGSFRGESRFSTWAWAIATRVVLAARRRRSRQPIPIEAFEADLADGFTAGARVEDAVLLRQVKIGCGRAMLQCLDDDLLLAYTLGEILEIPGPEAAAAVGVTPAAFRKRLSRARAAVRGNLSRVCGLVEAAAPCRCAGRVRPALRLGRLDERDGEGALDVDTLRHRLAELDALSRAAAYYRADPQLPVPALVAQVRRVLGL